MDTNHVLLIIYWIGFGIVHSVLAANIVKQPILRSMKNYAKFYRLMYAVIAFVSLVFIVWFQLSIRSTLLFSQLWLRLLIGLPLSIAGAIIMIDCAKKYFLHLTGLDVFVKQEPVNVLQTTGLHKYTRHPLYLGTFMFIFGLFFCFPYTSNLIAVVIIVVYTIIGAWFEEKKLAKEFGEEYINYQQKVPMIIKLW